MEKAFQNSILYALGPIVSEVMILSSKQYSKGSMESKGSYILSLFGADVFFKK